MAQTSVPSLNSKSVGSQKKLGSCEEKTMIDISFPNATNTEETVFDIGSGTVPYCFGTVDIESNINFRSWLETLPHDVQKDILDTIGRINEMSPAEFGELQGEKITEDKMERVIPVSEGTHPLQNAFNLRNTALCSRRGCHNKVYVDTPSTIFCSEHTP